MTSHKDSSLVKRCYHRKVVYVLGSYYYSQVGGRLKVVHTLSRRKQRACSHTWRRRRYKDIQSNWASVCKLCGAFARGPR